MGFHPGRRGEGAILTPKVRVILTPIRAILIKDCSLDEKEGEPHPVKTIVSCHQYTDKPDLTNRSEFYIFAGDGQGPLHGAGRMLSDSGISSGHGKWAGGGNFHEGGTIRLDGNAPKPVCETKNWEFAVPRIAVVEMSENAGGAYWDGPGVKGTRGPGMNRIGRDRDCHAFQGRLHEVYQSRRTVAHCNPNPTAL